MNTGVKVFGVIAAVVLAAMTTSAYTLPTLAAPDMDQDRLRDQLRTCDGSGEQIRNRDQNSTCLRLEACYSVQAGGQYSTGNGFGAETRSGPNPLLDPQLRTEACNRARLQACQGNCDQSSTQFRSCLSEMVQIREQAQNGLGLCKKP